MSTPSSTATPLLPPTWSPWVASSAAKRTAALQPNEQRLGGPATTSRRTRRVSPSQPSPPVAAQPSCRRTGRGGALSSPRTDLLSTPAKLPSTTQLSATGAEQDDWFPAAQPAQAALQSSKPCPPQQDPAKNVGNTRPAKGPRSPSRPRALRSPRKGRRQAVDGEPPIMRPAHPGREPRPGQACTIPRHPCTRPFSGQESRSPALASRCRSVSRTLPTTASGGSRQQDASALLSARKSLRFGVILLLRPSEVLWRRRIGCREGKGRRQAPPLRAHGPHGWGRLPVEARVSLNREDAKDAKRTRGHSLFALFASSRFSPSSAAATDTHPLGCGQRPPCEALLGNPAVSAWCCAGRLVPSGPASPSCPAQLNLPASAGPGRKARRHPTRKGANIGTPASHSSEPTKGPPPGSRRRATDHAGRTPRPCATAGPGSHHPPRPLHPALLRSRSRCLRSHPAIALCQEPPRPHRMDPENRRKSLPHNMLRHIPQLGAHRAQAGV